MTIVDNLFCALSNAGFGDRESSKKHFCMCCICSVLALRRLRDKRHIQEVNVFVVVVVVVVVFVVFVVVVVVVFVAVQKESVKKKKMTVFLRRFLHSITLYFWMHVLEMV
jgi:hypothetical protein